MMDKKSNEGLRCVRCGADAIPGSDPAVCEDHMGLKKEANDLESLDSVSQNPDIWKD